MSSIQKRSNGTYLVRWRPVPGGPERSQSFKLKRDADTFVKTIDFAVLEGTYIDPAAGRITFREYSVGWLERKQAAVKPTTLSTYRTHLDAHLLPAFGDVPLRSITREHVKTWAARLEGGGLAPTTARAIVFTLAAVLREAVDDGRLVRNPAERVKVGAKTERRVDPMHIAHVSGKVPALADAMPSRWRAAVLLMASTGLRLGECMGLTVDRVDFLRRSIRIDRQLVEGGGFGTPKTRAGVRSIPVPVAVVELLAEHLRVWPTGESNLVFTTEQGRPVARNRWADSYRQACAEVGLEGRTRTHDLRHVAASSLIASGLSVAAVQAVLGHASPAETLEVYTHLWPSDEERTRLAIDAAATWLRAAAD